MQKRIDTLDIITTVYDPESTIGQITDTQRDTCAHVLTQEGYECIAGASSPENDGDARLDMLANHALEETAFSSKVILPHHPDSRDQVGKIALIGPNPYVELGVGLWVKPG